jgi:hypothetical protein
MVACGDGERHDPNMRRDRGQQADLFTTAAAFQEASPPPQAKQSSAQKRRHVLPNDLPNAVKHLDDRELDLLITASLQEAKRRGRLYPAFRQTHLINRYRSDRQQRTNRPTGGKWEWRRSC